MWVLQATYKYDNDCRPMIIISNRLLPLDYYTPWYYNYGYIFVFFIDAVATQQWCLLDVTQLNDTLKDLKCWSV